MTAAREISTPAALRAVMGADFAFSDQQFAAITAPLAPAVIVAGAGSGKTEVMAARVVYLVATGQVSADEVLGLTFTTKAASELLGRIRKSLRAAGMLGRTDRPPGPFEDPVEPTVATYNAYAAGLLTEHGLRIGHEPDTRVIADASRYQLAARAISHHTGLVVELTDNLRTVIGYLLQLDAQLSEHMVSPDELRRWQEAELPRWAAAAPGPRGGRRGVDGVLQSVRKRTELLGLVEDYRALKLDLGLMDFSDQTSRGARLALEHPAVGEQERRRFKVVLLDEYQDTSVAQARMLSALFSGPTRPEGRGHPVTAVGDPNQAIYGWRGASVSNILGFGADFPTADGEAEPPVHRLTVNRRSDRRILSAANLLAATLYADTRSNSAPLEPRPEALEGTVRVALSESYDDELDRLVGDVRAAHRAMDRPQWRQIGVLTRDNAHAADVYDRLTAADVPVEIVGINGLLRLPEVAEVVATLQLLHDLTANASLLTLLAGPRWAVGARDLALLGRRARSLAGAPEPGVERSAPTIEEQLAAAVAQTDSTDLASLSEAMDDPGPAGYSPGARERFALLAAELRHLRGFVGEPLVDLVRRIIDVSGIEVELAASGSRSAESRRENLDAFVGAVADFESVDGQMSLQALLAYLDAEDELGNGLDVATPSAADSVKLLTVHRAKGLEWDVVFLPGVCETKFPNTQGRTQWIRGPSVLPTQLRGDARDLPQLAEYSESALNAYPEQVRAHDATEQLRLGYVAFTRARHTMVVSGHWWKPGRKRPMGPSEFLLRAADSVSRWGGAPEAWYPAPGDDADNPVLVDRKEYPWPASPDGPEVSRRHEAASLVRAAMAQLEAGTQPEIPFFEAELSAADATRVAEWDVELDRLLRESAAETPVESIDLPMPPTLSATSLTRLREDPAGLAAEVARPMPRPPSRGARFGTRFHAWVERRFGQQHLLGLDDIPDRADAGIDDDSELELLKARFEAGPFGDRIPFAIEAPFALVLGGQVVRGRIDAVYREPDGFLLVDWKTSRQPGADPLQLAIYRVAWADLHGLPPDSVEVAFYYVRTGEVVRPAPGQLADRSELERLVAAPGAGGSAVGTPG